MVEIKDVEEPDVTRTMLTDQMKYKTDPKNQVIKFYSIEFYFVILNNVELY